MLRVSILNRYMCGKTMSSQTPNTQNAMTAAPVQTSTGHVAFGAKSDGQAIAYNPKDITDKARKDARRLGDGAKLTGLLNRYSLLDSYKFIKVDISESRFSATKGKSPFLSVRYNMWDDYLFSYSLEENGVLETRKFDKKGKPLSITIERSVQDAVVIKDYTGNEKNPFYIKVKSKPSSFYSESGIGSVEKRYTQKNTVSTLESYEYALSNIRSLLYTISYPNKNQKGFNIYCGPNVKAAFPNLESAREYVFQLAGKDCGNSAMEKLRSYAKLLDTEERKKL